MTQSVKTSPIKYALKWTSPKGAMINYLKAFNIPMRNFLDKLKGLSHKKATTNVPILATLVFI